MGLSIGIVGLPNVGKSTLFNALTKKSVPAENYPFCTIDPSVGIVAVPDERLWKLSEFSKSRKTIPAAIEFVDIAGLVKGASTGEGLGNQFLTNIRETDAIAEVVRIFDDDKVIHVSGKVSPVDDIETINLELILADMQTVAKRTESAARDAKRGDKNAALEGAALARINEALQAEKFASTVPLDEKETPLIHKLQLLTMKPILYVLNKKAGGKNLDQNQDERWKNLMNYLQERGAKWVIVDAGIESELSSFEGAERDEMRSMLTGLNPSEADGSPKDDGINNLISKGYELLGLQTYFTTGEDESRAWTVKIGATAPEAGMAIHTDFKEKFIRAEVVFWSDLLAAGSYGKARELGKVRTEGKEYVVKDGDVIEFKI